MPITAATKSKTIDDALRRFPQFPSRTIARYLLADYGDLFDNNLEKIRTAVRYRRGTLGESHRPFKKVDQKDVEIPKTWGQTRTQYKLSKGLWLIINDLHIPFHSIKAIEAALNFGKKNKIDGICINGDAQDCASISFWPATRKRNFDGELEMFVDFLDHLRQEFPKQKIVYKPGNHEYRLPRLFQTKVPDLMGLPLAAMDTVLGLEERNIELLDYFQLVYAGKLPILHGHEVRLTASTVNPARGLFLKTKMWSMCGHHHRTSEHTDINLEGDMLTTWSVGCLCNLSPDYSPYGNNWNWGFALVDIQSNGDFEVENRRILQSGKVV